MSIKNTLAVSEFFLSIQGEGQTAGRPAYFLRLAGCNLLCGGKGTIKDGGLHGGATWRCDSIEVWMKGKSKTFAEIVQNMGGNIFIDNLRNDVHLIITGGEPLMQQTEIGNFITYLQLAYGITPVVEIETNGTVMPSLELIQKITYWNVSPKLKNSGELFSKRYKAEVIQQLSELGPRTMFKFVVSEKSDWIEIENTFLDDIKDRRQIWLMPGCDNQSSLLRVSLIVAELAIEQLVNVSTRLQIITWDKTVGV